MTPHRRFKKKKKEKKNRNRKKYKSQIDCVIKKNVQVRELQH